ncbi:hypothetical protein Pelo_9264 [Pelomyxa schiedti]|nr:hypothetical protein Pelo_9264 [Pelomyxa schiedti]
MPPQNSGLLQEQSATTLGEGVVHRLARVVGNFFLFFWFQLLHDFLHFRICGTVVDFAGRDDSPRSIPSLLNIGHT